MRITDHYHGMDYLANERVEDFITIYPKMVGMEMGLYVPISYAWETLLCIVGSSYPIIFK